MATPTYDLLDSVTLSSSAASVTFSSITQDYRDLIVISQPTHDSTGSNFYARFNGDSGSNYSYVYMRGNGSTASSSNGSSQTEMSFGRADGGAVNINQIMDYSATDKHKTVLERRNDPDDAVWAFAHRWASTSAITSIALTPYSGNFDSGSTFYLYGVAS